MNGFPYLLAGERLIERAKERVDETFSKAIRRVEEKGDQRRRRRAADRTRAVRHARFVDQREDEQRGEDGDEDGEDEQVLRGEVESEVFVVRGEVRVELVEIRLRRLAECFD